ncbi:MAG: peptidoglycan DD-metalloendopeptidase family protein [Rubrivivax sp.]
MPSSRSPRSRLSARLFGLAAVAAVAAVVTLTGCASSAYRAPVEDRGSAGRDATLPVPAPGAAASAPGSLTAVEPSGKALPGSENAGKPGYYSVKRGDTLYKIAQQNGQSWRDIARWSNLENPSAIEIGQVLRIVPPAQVAVAAAPAAVAPVATVPPVVTKPIVIAPQPEVRQLEPRPVAKEGDDDIDWMWPANGPVIGNFDDVKTKGLSIAGSVGDPVLASADGRVVYAGAGLRGYGNLVIVKHNNTYLTAYAHNQTLLVKEDQVVLRGQKIAEMGSSDSDRVQLHFEIRRQGKPIDPAKLLPPR